MAEQMDLFGSNNGWKFVPFTPGDNVYHCKDPNCGIEVITWRKSVIAAAARSLIKLVYLYRGEYVHLDEFIVEASDRGNGNFSQLVNFKLIERKPNDDPAKHHSGFYRPTPLGIKFATGKILIPKYIITRLNELKGYNEPMVWIWEAAKLNFDFQKLMRDNFGSLQSIVDQIEKEQ